MSTIATAIVEVTAPVRLFLEPGQRYCVLYLLPQMAFAVWYTRRRRDRHPPISPGTVRHRSTRHDLMLLATNAALVAPIAAIAFQSGRIVRPVRDAIEAVAGRHSLLSGWQARVFITVAIALAADFGFFIAHFLEHRVPALWQIHRVHHSAPILTPLTNGREHPLDEIFHALFVTLALSVTAAASLALVTPDVRVVSIEGTNVVILASFLALSNLRHSGTWISFGRRIEHVISSPAQHQIHHSRDPRHFDRNLAVMFSLWD
jgi:sterol desaturase/sphingolipid hydroxylase (fatty acid hydroxylase superfamily)